MPRIIEINDLNQLAGYRLLWHKLLAETRHASYFQSLDWLENYWRHRGAGQTLRVLVVRSGDETLGILPLIVRTESTRFGPLRVLTYPLDDWGNFFGPIGSQPAATLAAALHFIQQRPRDWDLLDLRGVNRDGCDFGRTPNALGFNQFQVNEQPWRTVPTIDLSEGWNDYWNSRDDALRTKVTEDQHRLEQQGTVEFLRYRPAGAACDDDDPRWDLYDACASIAAPGLPFSVEVRDYFRDAYASAAHAGALDMGLLLVDHRPVAYAYGYHFQGQSEWLRLGVEAEFASLEPANLLLHCVLSDSCERADHTVRFGGNTSVAVNSWLTGVETSYRYTHYPWTVARAQALRFNRWAFGRRRA